LHYTARQLVTTIYGPNEGGAKKKKRPRNYPFHLPMYVSS